jgi:transposase
MTEHLTLSHKELDRLQIITRIAERRLTRRHAAELLKLSERQVYRLYAAFKARGAAGLASAKRGRPSHRKIAMAVREQALGLIGEH